MLNLTKLLTAAEFPGDEYRYREHAGQQLHGVAPGKGPVVVWNYTNACNLNCRHCYAAAGKAPESAELTTEEGLRLIDDLAEFHVPVILLSGGEPLCRKDFLTLVTYAREKGIRVTLSTNGTLIDPAAAATIKAAGIGYVGISLDGVRERNDQFRGSAGAYDLALQGIRNLHKAGQRTGLRFTISQSNFRDIPAMFDLLEEEEIDRICFYHLVYSGRGSALRQEDLTHAQTREVMDLILERTLDLKRRGLTREVLMVDNHTDGVYLYLKYRDTDPQRADYIRTLLRRNGGNRSGMAIGCIDPAGNVHPDQFTWQHTLGNVRERSFSEIWTDTKQPLLAKLKDRKPWLPETCLSCSWLDMCNGNFRTRAEAETGDFWGMDPACYLTEEERTGEAR